MDSSYQEDDFTHVVDAFKGLAGFNESAFNQLVEDTDRPVVLRILARYCINMDEAFADIEKGMSQDDSEMVWRSCHKLVGTAELIGFKNFGEKSRELNLDIKASLDLHAYSDELSIYVKEGRELLSKIRASFPALQNYL